MKRAERPLYPLRRTTEHPDLHVAWGKVGVDIWTHKIGGLTESDVVFAAKCDALYSGVPHGGG